MNENSKATNPKDAIATTKLALDLVPDSGVIYASMAFLEGALKYGKFNWRIAGVRWSVYDAALERHRMKLRAGEWVDPVTGVPHIASMIACLMIIADAHENDKLVDDRPPRSVSTPQLIDGLMKLTEHLKDTFKNYDPKQFTIDDGVEGDMYGNWPGKPTDSSREQTPPFILTPGEDAQPIPRRHGGHVVFREPFRSVDRVEVDSVAPKAAPDQSCTCAICTSGRVAGC